MIICKRYNAKVGLGSMLKLSKAQSTLANVLPSQGKHVPAENIPLLGVTNSENVEIELFCRIDVSCYLTQKKSSKASVRNRREGLSADLFSISKGAKVSQVG